MVRISVLIRCDRLDYEGEATIPEVLQILDRFFSEVDDPEQELARAKARLDASSKVLEDAVRADPGQPVT